MGADRPARLYTPAVLALATGLSAYPLEDSLTLRAEARSRTCGSVVAVGLDLAGDGTIARIGLQVRACAIGQASAALLAQDAQDRTADDLGHTRAALERWLAGEGALPDWPGLDLIAPARAHLARHSALLLPWTAASKALSRSVSAG